jgi:Zeta toxin
MMPDSEGDSSGRQSIPKFGTSDTASVRRRFAELLERDPEAVLDATRDSGGHVVLNADDLFKRWPEYEVDPRSRPILGPLLYPVAKEFINRLFGKLLTATPTTGTTVVFTAGGGASGKSTILRAQANRPEVDFVVDTTFSDVERAIGQITESLDAGRLVEINYVYRDFKEAVLGMIERALDPKVGRIVPIDDMARTHFGAQETIFTILERYENEPRVAIRLWESLPGNEVKPMSLNGLLARVLPDIDELQHLGQTVLDESYEAARHGSAGQWENLSDHRSFYEAARSKALKGIQAPRDLDHQRDTEGGEGG